MSTVPARADVTRLLEAAALASLRAPSVFNTQPWRWRIIGDTLELSADPGRGLAATDSDGRLLVISCGTALHHARTALAAAGHRTAVTRLPDPDRHDLLARIRVVEPATADPETRAMADAMPRRRTDRRTYGDRPVPEDLLGELRHRVEAEGAFLHVVRPDQVMTLAVAADRAAAAEQDDPAYAAELRDWSNRPAGSGDGVPAATAVQPSLRRVPVRDFAPAGDAGLAAGGGHDRGAAYVLIFGRTDRPIDLLRGGEALSALLLTATARGLATEPLSESAEVAWGRTMLRGLLAGIGEPYLAVRLGYPDSPEPPPAAPRRDPAEVIIIEGPRP